MGAYEKSTVDQIRDRFDNDVERFSNFETGQTSTIDAAFAMRLVARAAAAATPAARHVLDVGCGAGNYTLALLEHLPHLDVTLVDLSRPMLDRAAERIRAAGAGRIETRQGDLRELELAPGSCDVVLASAVLHHLRSDAEWDATFAQFHEALRNGGSLWVFDLVLHAIDSVQALMWSRYGEYLTTLRDEAYRDQVFTYIAQEDSPRPLLYQVDPAKLPEPERDTLGERQF